jgi:hypothetical protein
MTMGDSPFSNEAGGHSTNCVKLKRNTAFSLYSCAGFDWACKWPGSNNINHSGKENRYGFMNNFIGIFAN